MMKSPSRTYIAIDLKSFYASAECVAMGLDPLDTHLVVADASRTEKTICLAVTPSLKSYGISGRARLFEVVQAVRRINAERRAKAPGRRFSGKSHVHSALQRDPSLELEYIVAPPRMAHYMEVSSQIYGIYLRHVSPEDIQVYSIDEVFIDATDYGPNLYLCKIAMDIEAKHSPADADGVRIAELDELSYRRKYWTHRPLTDFWRIGRGIAAKLEANGLYTLGDVARCSVAKPYERQNIELLYKLFGVGAELLIDHAWGWEPCTMDDIRSYRPTTSSLSSGQVLSQPYSFRKARVVIHEMTEQLVLSLVDKQLLTDQMVLHVGYDISSLTDPAVKAKYNGPVTQDWYGRPVPKPAHGSVNLPRQTSSTRQICDAVLDLFDRIVNRDMLVRRMYVVAAHLVQESSVQAVQLDLFDEPAEPDGRERSRQEAILAIRRKFGTNAILTGTNFDEGATGRERHKQIGGHKA